MKVALLGSKDTFHIADYMKSVGDEVICKEDKVNLEWLKSNNVEFIVSHGYGYILKKDILEAYKNKAVNLHISYLPWGKGRSPLFWDLLEGNPTGVTIHYIDEGIDTGDIIAQNKVEFTEDETFRMCFARLRYAVEILFRLYWVNIREGNCYSYKQSGIGTYHKPEEMKAYQHLLYNGWDTPIKTFAKVLK